MYTGSRADTAPKGFLGATTWKGILRRNITRIGQSRRAVKCAHLPLAAAYLVHHLLAQVSVGSLQQSTNAALDSMSGTQR